MSVIATAPKAFSAIVKHEYEPAMGYCRDVVVVNDSAATFKVGTVLGKVTATGKYKVVEASAVDGSQVAAAVVIGDAQGNTADFAVAATTDTNVLVLARGPAIVGAANLVFGASVDTGGELTTAYGQLKAVGIVVETQA